ncbi:MAG: hypothetical protein M3Q27_09760 [Actinomycetota bacterium]|nr:hypothetical protein [Actinomycetota bacterium]
MRLWKVLGLAGVAGVAATGVAVARGERRAYTPGDVRARLHEPIAAAPSWGDAEGDVLADGARPQHGQVREPVAWRRVVTRPAATVARVRERAGTTLQRPRRRA